MSRKQQVGDQIVKLIVGAGQASPSPPVGPALGSKGVKSMDFCKVSTNTLRTYPRTHSISHPIPYHILRSITTTSTSTSPSPRKPTNSPFQEFNARTANYVPGTPVPARVTVRPDRSFTFELRTPPTTSLLLSAAGVAPKKNKLRGAGNTAGPHSKAGLAGQGKATGAHTANGNAGLGAVGSVSLKHVFEIARIKHSEPRLSGLTLRGVARSVVAQAGSIGVVVVP